ncbi:DUF4838 domain-containing protein [Cellulophaga sp. F20128]|uniref:DUF4838 domain-containing protein n=1 Tax=Cellulophaga sp. F20128 TaxID=2926413 RepID=UPI001FF45A5D|nr:DUF4838 domain-containing protein [Cellulophaga sp. F20128]MCK0156437.1 DUF4838 domain-containing protein [Cellulophaga sp. F20128]
MKNRKSVLLVFLIVSMVLFQSCTETTEELVIVANGASNYEIVYRGDATESQYQSAQLIQDYIFKITAVKLPITDESSQGFAASKIYVGTLDSDVLEGHAISIKTENKNIFISGGSDAATRDAVYSFLENQLGCKWYAPNVEVLPKKDKLVVNPIEYTYKPEITTRTVHSKLYYDNHAYADQQKVTYEAFPNYAPGARVHTFHRFVPEEYYYKSHPEYYALRGDKRLPTQLCLTNIKVLQIVKDSVAMLFKKYPGATVVSVSQDDNQQHCQCEDCSRIDTEEGSPSGTMIRFVNKVAAEFPTKTISTLAYQYTRKPCKTKPLDNVLITLCSIECDRSAPIEEKCKDFADDLKGWGKISNNIRIWDYTTQFTNFLSPFPNLHTLQSNIQLFRDNNAKWVFEQHSNHPSDLFELRSYITAKLLWNPDLDFNDLLTEFTDGYYEEAGVYVKQYVDLIHSKIKEDKDFFLFLYGDPSEAFSSYLSKDLLVEYSELFKEALLAVAAKPKIIARVKMARLGLDYAILEASRKNISDDFSLTRKGTGGALEINPRAKQRLEDFKATCASNNVTLMNEMGFTVKEYYSNYMLALEISQKPNKALGKNVIALTTPKKYANENPMVLTDGALGGSSFYSNWLGFEGNDMKVVLDLGKTEAISSISLAFLQVTNHIVFLPETVSYFGSLDGVSYAKIGEVNNTMPLDKKSKVNDIKYFDFEFATKNMRYLKIEAKNTKTPYWHHAAGLPSWIFADEIMVN